MDSLTHSEVYFTNFLSTSHSHQAHDQDESSQWRQGLITQNHAQPIYSFSKCLLDEWIVLPSKMKVATKGGAVSQRTLGASQTLRQPKEEPD